MDNIVSLVLEKGITFAIAVVAVGLVGYFLKSERDERNSEFQDYRATMKLTQKEMNDAALAVKSSCFESIRTMKLESAAIISQMESFKQTLSREIMGMKVHSVEIHNRSENIKKSINELIGEVRVIKTSQEQYEEIFKKIIEKSKSKGA